MVNKKERWRGLRLWLSPGFAFRFRAHAAYSLGMTDAGVSQPAPPPPRPSRTLGKLDFAALLLIPPTVKAALSDGNLFTLYQVQTQDFAVLVALIVVLPILQRWTPAWRLPNRMPRGWILLGVGAAIAVLLGWAAHALLWNFPISRDEHMVVFDMAVYAKGRLAAPLAAEWRDFAEALVPAFLLNAQQPLGLVSGYLPMNAVLRLAFAQMADPAWFNPVLALAGGVALFDIARRLFADDVRAQWITLLVYALSSQMLVNAMTAYAMTGHMALSLVWLAAFLRGGRAGHAIAIGVAFVAVGFHQLAFHPLFAAPFILWRLIRGERRTTLLYVGAYALILACWAYFPILASAQTGVAAAGRDDTDLAQRILPLLLHRDPLTLSLMMLNLVRFVAWQHLALLPLFLAALPAVWRDKGPGAPMLWSIVLGTAFMAFVLPYQGHGWGYRYLHPYLGCFALLAGLGYQRLAAASESRTQGMFVVLSLLTAFGSFPWLLWQAREFTAPHVVLDRYIAAQRTDFVLVDTDLRHTTTDGSWEISAIDEVRNDPDLTNRPLSFSSRDMNAALVTELCRRGSVSVVSGADMHRLGFGLNVPAANPRLDRLVQVLRDGDCLAPRSGDGG
jgi:hypothetical protein